jgi:hypothetical protein
MAHTAQGNIETPSSASPTQTWLAIFFHNSQSNIGITQELMTSNMRIKHELMKDNEQLVSRSINNGNENGGVNGQSAVEIHSFPSFRNGNI